MTREQKLEKALEPFVRFFSLSVADLERVAEHPLNDFEMKDSTVLLRHDGLILTVGDYRSAVEAFKSGEIKDGTD